MGNLLSKRTCSHTVPWKCDMLKRLPNKARNLSKLLTTYS